MVLTDITASGDDYLGAYETTGAVAVGGSVTGNLEVDNDVDWFRVPLEAGKSYRIGMRGAGVRRRNPGRPLCVGEGQLKRFVRIRI